MLISTYKVIKLMLASGLVYSIYLKYSRYFHFRVYIFPQTAKILNLLLIP
uniref:Uncharacterized protein n=1 Tax=Siphoviridae sp. ctcfw7 TaxID=2826394 RepID=A0A8S5MG27_9CAUD|nr:MAG TPA: hypothetical protein [Siphoviridae sp. ctcfw7]